MPFSPLGKGYLTGTIDDSTNFDSTDFRNAIPRFSSDARRTNRAFVDLLQRIAACHSATPAQVALPWLLQQKPWIVPIPGTTKLRWVQENAAAADLELTADDLSDIEHAQLAAQGDRYPAEAQRMIDR